MKERKSRERSVGVNCNVSPTLLMKEKRSVKLYLRSPTLLREMNGVFFV
jgi:hypothetical protein